MGDSHFSNFLDSPPPLSDLSPGELCAVLRQSVPAETGKVLARFLD